MRHPNIATVLDAGTTESGRPYFVMELVDGISVTQFCAAQSHGVTDCLKLFLKICGAIRHAHQKGIIHRNLKPSNILVSMVDGERNPRVIDFDLVKVTRQLHVGKEPLTPQWQMVGTL